MVLEGLNKELAVREPPGLGIKEGAAISNTLTLKMEAQDIYNMVQMFRIPKCSTLNFEFFLCKRQGGYGCSGMILERTSTQPFEI